MPLRHPSLSLMSSSNTKISCERESMKTRATWTPTYRISRLVSCIRSLGDAPAHGDASDPCEASMPSTTARQLRPASLPVAVANGEFSNRRN